ncbi:hypothetical protein M413DRAFT_212284 [Hebeloma cylindrosporum]|uniref:Uncharacterized protein n=1 Tax=Hebeloma cylindrosporum TaxID=76867 RepID=A0A0C2Z3S5_HEBCY|nr:hypothetical protein M413DRAFT_212284 [Hebeloma cylindrosporum h7]
MHVASLRAPRPVFDIRRKQPTQQGNAGRRWTIANTFVCASGHNQILRAFVPSLHQHACACTHKPIRLFGNSQVPQTIGKAHNIVPQACPTPPTIVLSPSPTHRNDSERNAFRYRA